MYVIYHVGTNIQFGPNDRGAPGTRYAKPFKTLGAALRVASKWNAQAGPGPDSFAVVHVDHSQQRG